MIRAAFLALFAVLLLAGCGREDKRTDTGPALWEIADPKGIPAGWLFGTAHALPDDVQWRTARLDQALGAAQLLVVEVGNVGDDRAIAETFARMSTGRASPPLADRVDPEARGRLAALLSREDAEPRSFDHLETWAAALAIARLSGQANPTEGVDRALITGFSGRPVVELEGAEAQLAIFDRLPEREQRDLLAAVIAEGEQARSVGSDLARAWAAGDLARLELLATRGMLADLELREALLTTRNRIWAGRIARMLTRGEQPFIAVGAAHMLGPDGLPALLAAQGFTVRRIQ